MSKQKRGFALLSKERRLEIASQGGKSAHAAGVAHEFSKDEAVAAGKKGGAAVSRDRDHMAAIGRKGGKARKKKTTKP